MVGELVAYVQGFLPKGYEGRLISVLLTPRSPEIRIETTLRGRTAGLGFLKELS